MKKILSFFVMTILFANCRKTSLFTEIDANFKNLKDVYVQEFQGHPHSITQNSELDLDAKEALTGHYGTVLSLDVWEFASEEESKKAYETLYAVEKEKNPREYSQTREKEYRFQYVRETGVTGELFTVKKILFRFLAEDRKKINDYLVQSQLARIR